jgi:hypothetical protein
MRHFLFLSLIIITTRFLTGQQIETKRYSNLVQLTGRLYDELLQPLPYGHILILNNYKGTITDKQGKFTLVTQVYDTVMFSCVGYRRKNYVIPDTLSEPFLDLEVNLDIDTIMIGQIEIYPWKNYEEFKEAFLNLKLPEDDMERARRNIALIKTQIILDETPNASENFSYILNQQYKETFRQGTVFPTYNLFNAFAWAEFFNALKRGDFKKYSKPDD